MANDHNSCAACQFIGKTCPPECPLAPHFPAGTSDHGFDRLSSRLNCKTLIASARLYESLELRLAFVEQAVNVAAGPDGYCEEGLHLLVEAILLEADKACPGGHDSGDGGSCTLCLMNTLPLLDETVDMLLSKLADVEPGDDAFKFGMLDGSQDDEEVRDVIGASDNDREHDVNGDGEDADNVKQEEEEEEEEEEGDTDEKGMDKSNKGIKRKIDQNNIKSD